MIAKLREKANGLSGDERAVSPVVGVALLIAITVILAAVIGFVVLNTTDAQNAASTDARMTFSWDSSAGTVTINHEGGDSIAQSNIIVKADGAKVTPSTINSDDSQIGTGDSIVVPASAGDTIVVVYEDPNSDRETQLGRFEVPT